MRTLVAVLLILVFGLTGTVAMVKQQNSQFAFQVVSEGTEKKLVIPRAAVVIELIPLSGPTVKAPLNRGDFMLCRQFDFVDEEKILHTGLQCGSDEYAISRFGFEESR
jgi:hypothetical protein